MSEQQIKEKPKVSAISLSWNANFLQRKDQIGPYSEYAGIQTKVKDTAEKILAIGVSDEIVAYTNPEWLSPEEIDRKYGKRIEKLAKDIGYEIVDVKFVPRYPEGHPQSNQGQGTKIYTLKKNPDLKPIEPRPKSDDELRMIGFKNADQVKEGDLIEYRYTNSYNFYRKIGKVMRVNPRSIRIDVGFYQEIKGQKVSYPVTHYFKANTLNNAVFLIPEGRFDEIKASVDKFTEDEKKKKEIIDGVLSQVKFEIKPVIDVVDPNTGEHVHEMSITELIHPTTFEGVKAVAQIEAAEERQAFQINVLENLVNKKLKEAGLK